MILELRVQLGEISSRFAEKSSIAPSTIVLPIGEEVVSKTFWVLRGAGPTVILDGLGPDWLRFRVWFEEPSYWSVVVINRPKMSGRRALARKGNDCTAVQCRWYMAVQYSAV